MTLTLESDGPEATRRIGRALGAVLSPGDCVALIGPLGAGKTCLARGLAEGLGCDNALVHSPSYVLVLEYQGRCPVYHCDWYRLDSDDDVESTGFDDLTRGGGVIVIEWADKHPGRLPTPRVEVEIACLAGDRRLIQLKEIGLEGLLDSAMNQ